MTTLMVSLDQLRAATSDGRPLKFVPWSGGNCDACAISQECYDRRISGRRRCTPTDRADDAWGHWEAVT